MMTTLDETATRPSWILRAVLAVGVLALLALPVVYFTAPDLVQAKGPASSKDRAARGDDGREKPEFLPPRSDREEAILAKLDQPTMIDFVDMPLEDAATFLDDYHTVEIQLDKRALEEAGLGSDTPMTLNLEGVPLRSGLRQLLKPHDLTFIIHNDVLLITTQDAAESLLVTRTYPVGDLIDPNTVGSQPNPSQALANYETLTDVITRTVAAPSWKDDGGNGSIMAVPNARSLVIAQTYPVHDEVLKLLRALRAAK